MATIPRIIRNFNVFIDGTNFAGICEEVTLPALKIITDDHRAGGMDSPVAIDLGVERLELKFTMAEHHATVFGQFGLIGGNDVSLLFRAAKLGGNGNAPTPYYVTVQGMYMEVTPGSVKTGEKSTLEATISCRKYKVELEGSTLIDIDVDNMKRIINGNDQMAAIRGIIDA